jgi:trehalose 6-phosphate phosphatase
MRSLNTVSVKRYGEGDNGQKNGHTATTLSPRILPRCGKGRQESRVYSLSAPAFTGATADDVAALDGEALALFLDVDGTLIDLAARPGDVVVPAGLVETLAKVERKLAGALAFVSGRVIADLDRLFKPLRLRASGVHGAEMRFDPGRRVESTAASTELPRSLRTALTRAIAAFPGAFVEDKRFSLVVHYRLATSAEGPLREAVTRIIDAAKTTAVEVIDGHCAIELKAPGFDKGGAIAAFLSTAAFRDRTPVFVGDDASDESGFALVAARGGYAYSVGRRRWGTIGVFPEPKAVRDWLAEFALRRDNE